MNFKFFFSSLILTILLISCRNSTEQPATQKFEKNNTTITQDHPIQTDTTGIHKTLQGIWKESEYPYRQLHFENNLVKFTEEGVIEEPMFREFKILRECPFDVNNIKTTRPEDIFLVVIDEGTCERLRIANNFLSLSGFNISTQTEYSMAFEKVE